MPRAAPGEDLAEGGRLLGRYRLLGAEARELGDDRRADGVEPLVEQALGEVEAFFWVFLQHLAKQVRHVRVYVLHGLVHVTCNDGLRSDVSQPTIVFIIVSRLVLPLEVPWCQDWLQEDRFKAHMPTLQTSFIREATNWTPASEGELADWLTTVATSGAK
eukprot:CAMPEP_0179358124 /NCGR_PEP_ID=MMETSP0797-20121207/78764_1 /TAXON_ID=47934 /ORGANISM="Dinophysis acuminata, Strain DAEP01" /LENGTH=159 /DNA_ID=CAMNT_0021073367 /DNA_START=93 /DNA_END=573 /DNA_ORIENTATION=+